MADNIGTAIARANGALEPLQAAHVIYASLFEQGDRRLSSTDKFVAISAITGGLVEWKKKFEDTKTELDNVRLRLAILQKEQ